MAIETSGTARNAVRSVEMLRGPAKRIIVGGGILLLSCAALVGTVRRRLAQHALGPRLRFENLISEVSAEFMNLPIDRMYSNFHRAMVRLAPMLHGGGIALLEFAADNTEVVVTHWDREVGGRNERFAIDALAGYLRRLMDNEKVLISDVDQLPDEGNHLKAFFQQAGIGSSLFIPLQASGEIIGAIALNSTRKRAGWPPPVVVRCRLLAQVFANSLLRRRAAAALGSSERMKESVRELSGKLICAQEEERSRIARELHDDICQQLALLGIDVRRIRDLDSTSQTAKESLSLLCKKVDQVSKDVHDLSHRIHSTKLNHLGLAAALRGLCEEFSQEHDMAIDFRSDAVPAKLGAGASLGLFRVAQEALSNVANHSNATHVHVELKGSPNELALRVSDDGVGFEVDSVRDRNHLGLISMQERLHSAGGVLAISSKPSLGTQIEARVPLQQESSGLGRAPDSAAA